MSGPGDAVCKHFLSDHAGVRVPRAQALLRLLTSCVHMGEDRQQGWFLEKKKALFFYITFEIISWISIQLSFKSELNIKPGFFFFY